MVSHRNPSDSKSPQVSRTLLSILADLNKAVVWMVFARPLISKSSSPWTNPLVTVPSVTITIGIIVTFIFYCFFSSLARSQYLSLFLLSFSFTLMLGKVHYSTGSSFSFLFFFFFFFDIHLIWLSGWNYVIRLYLKIPENFERLIFSVGF